MLLRQQISLLMKFQTIDGQEIRREIKPSRYPLRSREQSKSQGQYLLGRQLCKLYTGTVILEEFPVIGTRLSLDFYLPHIKLAFEYDGRQHREFNPFFHNTSKDFERQKERDQEKELWCKLNNIKLVRVTSGQINLETLKGLITG